MSSDVPPGVFKGEFTFSPKPNVTSAEVKTVVISALSALAAPRTEVEVSAEYTPIRSETQAPSTPSKRKS